MGPLARFRRSAGGRPHALVGAAPVRHGRSTGGYTIRVNRVEVPVVGIAERGFKGLGILNDCARITQSAQRSQLDQRSSARRAAGPPAS
jgi:hypothetical protein